VSLPAGDNEEAGRDAIPDRMFYKIGEVARITGLEPYVLRYWETEFPQISPRKGRGGQREYRRRDLDAILTVQRMLHRDGYTISGAKRKLLQADPDSAPDNIPEKAAAEGETPPGGGAVNHEMVQKTRKGLQELLQLMENTDSFRAN